MARPSRATGQPGPAPPPSPAALPASAPVATTPLLRGLVPLHHQVYAALSNALELGEWPPGERMPTERALAETFGCSLITVRRALDELVRERRIVRTRGLGTFARSAPVDRELTELTSFTDEMNARGLDPRTVLVSSNLTEASPAAADALGIQAGAAVYRIERVRHAGSQPLLLEEVQLPAHVFPGLLEADFVKRSLYDILAVDYGVELTRGEETVEPALPTAHEASMLDQDKRQPVLLLQLVSYTEGDVPIEYCRSVVRGDRARYHLEMKRSRTTLSLIAANRADRAQRRDRSR
jgi:GntR family transcriptional regulator